MCYTSAPMRTMKLSDLPPDPLKQRTENQILCHDLFTGEAQVRKGDVVVQRRVQTGITRWLARNKPKLRCRVRRLSPKTFAIWIEAK